MCMLGKSFPHCPESRAFMAAFKPLPAPTLVRAPTTGSIATNATSNLLALTPLFGNQKSICRSFRHCSCELGLPSER